MELGEVALYQAAVQFLVTPGLMPDRAALRRAVARFIVGADPGPGRETCPGLGMAALLTLGIMLVIHTHIAGEKPRSSVALIQLLMQSFPAPRWPRHLATVAMTPNTSDFGTAWRCSPTRPLCSSPNVHCFISFVFYFLSVDNFDSFDADSIC